MQSFIYLFATFFCFVAVMDEYCPPISVAGPHSGNVTRALGVVDVSSVCTYENAFEKDLECLADSSDAGRWNMDLVRCSGMAMLAKLPF